MKATLPRSFAVKVSREAEQKLEGHLRSREGVLVDLPSKIPSLPMFHPGLWESDFFVLHHLDSPARML